MKLRSRKTLGLFALVLIYLSNLSFYFAWYPEIGIWNKMVYSMIAIVFSPYHLLALVVGVYFLISRKRRIFDFILIIILAVLFLPIPPFFTAFPTPGFCLWGEYLLLKHTHVTGEGGIQYLQGNATLKVIILAPDDTPFQNMEVDLWTADAPPGPPNVGIKYTNESGVATFKIPAGDYKIGFNVKNFPKDYIYPEEIPVSVTEEKTVEKIIRLKPKSS
jgi:hypothetical protein